jgi:D-sedoheptulose 7-phosphate isomerase
MTFAEQFLAESIEILKRIDTGSVDAVAALLAACRAAGGRLFILGVGGSAANASHAVNDFRKICGFEAYAPTDNVSELTARVNDEGWEDSFSAWLEGSRISVSDAILVFSVGGGDRERGVSANIVRAVEVARSAGARVFGIVGRDGGVTRASGDASVLVPPLFQDRVTPHTEGLCAVVWHLLVSHPLLQRNGARWESMRAGAERR